MKTEVTFPPLFPYRRTLVWVLGPPWHWTADRLAHVPVWGWTLDTPLGPVFVPEWPAP